MKKTIILLITILPFAGELYALDMEMHVIREFLPIRSALSIIALIFSDNRYQGVVFVIMAASIAGGTLNSTIKSQTMGKPSNARWIMPMAAGTVVYLTLITNTGRIILEDDVTGQIETIPGIPDAVVMTLGTLNTVESGIINIIDTAVLDVEKRYITGSGGIGFDMIRDLTSKNLELPDRNMNRTVLAYVNDCLFLEMGQTGTTLTMDQINNNTNFIAEYAKAANPAVFTTVYTQAVPSGTAMTCFDARTGTGGIAAYLATTTNYDPIERVMCEEAGFDMNDPNQRSACQNIITQHVKITTDGTVATTAATYISQAYMANMLSKAAKEDDGQSSLMPAEFKNQTKGIAMGLMTSETIHLIKGALTAIAIGLTSILCFLLPTPLFGKVVSTVIGLFLYTTIWGITDCLVHALTIEYARDCFAEGSAFQLGYQAFFTAPTEAEKALGIFGTMRTVSTMIAAIITGMPVQQGGSLMGRMVGQASLPTREGAAELEKNQTLPGKGQTITSMRSGGSELLMSNYPQTNGFMKTVRANTGNSLPNLASGEEKFRHMPQTITSAAFDTNKARNKNPDRIAIGNSVGVDPARLAAKTGHENTTMRSTAQAIRKTGQTTDQHLERKADTDAYNTLSTIHQGQIEQNTLTESGEKDPAQAKGTIGAKNVLTTLAAQNRSGADTIKDQVKRETYAAAYQKEKGVEQVQGAETIAGKNAHRDEAAQANQPLKTDTKLKKNLGAETMNELTDRTSDANAFKKETDTKTQENTQEILGPNAADEQTAINTKPTQTIKNAQQQTASPTVADWTQNAAKTEGPQTNLDLAKKESAQTEFYNGTGGGTLDEMGHLEGTGTINKTLAQKMNKAGYPPSLFQAGTRIIGGTAALMNNRTVAGALPLNQKNTADVKDYLSNTIPADNPGKQDIPDAVAPGKTLYFRDIQKGGTGQEGFFSLKSGIEADTKHMHTNQSGTDTQSTDRHKNIVDHRDQTSTGSETTAETKATPTNWAI